MGELIKETLVCTEGVYIHKSKMDDLQSQLTKANEKIADLELQLADRKQKYEVAMDKGIDVMSYRLTKATELISQLEIVLRGFADTARGITEELTFNNVKFETLKTDEDGKFIEVYPARQALEEIAKWRNGK